MAQRPAVARSQPPLASSRSRAPLGRCSKSCSSSCSSVSGSSTPTFHLATKAEALVSCCRKVCCSAVMASAPAGSNTAEAGAGSHGPPGSPASSAKASPIAKATGPGRVLIVCSRCSMLHSAGSAATASAQWPCSAGKGAASPQPMPLFWESSNRNSQPRRSLQGPQAVSKGGCSAHWYGRQCSCINVRAKGQCPDQWRAQGR